MADDPTTRENLERVETKEKKGRSWIKDVPTAYLVMAVVLILVLINYAQSQPRGWSKALPWMIGVFVALYLLSQSSSPTTFLTEPEAKAALKKRIEEKKLTGEIDRNVYAKVDINAGEQFVEGGSMHYLIGVSFIYPDFKIVYKQAKVNSKVFGNNKVNITFQDSFGRVTGRETRDVYDWMKKVARMREKYGESLFKGIFTK